MIRYWWLFEKRFRCFDLKELGWLEIEKTLRHLMRLRHQLLFARSVRFVRFRHSTPRGQAEHQT